jgi:transcription elongation GreA/GreB family factor
MRKTANFTENQLAAVNISTKVVLKVNGEKQIWEIVNVGKADIKNGKISCEAPLIKCILGKREGETVKCNIMDEEFTIIIEKILPLQ